MQHCIGAAPECIDDSNCIFECLLRENVARTNTETQHVDNCFTCAMCIAFATCVDGRCRCTSWKTHAQSFCNGRHCVGGEHSAACALAGARCFFNLGQFALGNGACCACTDCFEHCCDVDVVAFVDTRHGGAVVDKHTCKVEARSCHEHCGNALVATGETDKTVEAFAVHHCFHAVGDDFAAHEAGAHSFVTHADPVGHGDGAEFEWHSTTGTNTSFCVLTETAKRHVAWRDFVPCRGNTDLRLDPVVVAKAHGAQHGTSSSLLNAVRYVAAARLDIDGGSVCVK